jgi:small nuclear ribonucleoprotein (snRNP)-like protein
VEFPYREYKDTYTTPMGEYGVLEQMFDKKTQDDKRWFKIQHYNTNLKLVATDSMLISKDMELYTCESDREICYSILRESDDSFLIVAYNTNTHKTNVVEGEYTHKGSMRSLCIENGYLVFSSTQKKIERIGIVNLKNGDTKYSDIHIDGVRDKKIFILENTIIDGEINSIVKVEENVYLMRFGLDGSTRSRILLTKDMKEYICNASVSKSGGKYFLTGTYTNKKEGMAQGIYFAQLEGDKFKFIKSYNFLNLKNFTEYMSSKKKAKVERRKEKAEKNGKEYSLNYHIASHKIMSENGYYYYLGEAYYPTYTTTRDGFGGVYATFNGYFYTHAVLVKFDNQGNIVWDNCFKMEPREKPFFVKAFVSASLKGNNVSTVFTDGKRLTSKLFRNSDGEVVKDRNTEILETIGDGESIKRARYTDSMHWYDENFKVHGNQTVKNSKTNERRRVRYISKYTIKE